jgi:hypothetical protein
VAAIAISTPGCRRQPGDQIRYSTGYVKLDELVHRHPGWQDVLQLDAMIAHASGLESAELRSATPVASPPLPQPLQRRPLLPEAISAEQRRIEAVQYPLRDRMNRLRNSTNVRIDRAVSVRERELRSTLDAELRQKLADLEEEARRERLVIEGKWYVPIRDLQLQVFALESQVETYKPFPASPAYKMSQERLAEKLAERDKVLAQLAQEIAAIDSALNQRLASARQEIDNRFGRQIADYRSDLEGKATGEAGERLAAMQRELSSLAPLERPRVPPAPEMRSMTIPSPSQLASAGGPISAPLDTDAEIAAIRAQRERLAQYLERDVKRRLNRLSAQHRWRLAFGQRPGLEDVTPTAEKLLVEEWTP